MESKQEKIDELKGKAIKSAGESALHLKITGFALASLGVTAVLGPLGGIGLAIASLDAITKEFKTKSNILRFVQEGLLAPFLGKEELKEYLRLVGEERCLEELQYAESINLHMAGSARKLLSALEDGDDEEVRKMGNFQPKHEISLNEFNVDKSSFEKTSFEKTSFVNESFTDKTSFVDETFTDFNETSFDGGEKKKVNNENLNLWDWRKYASQQFIYLIMPSGAGKDIIFSNLARLAREEGHIMFVFDAKDDPKEAGYFKQFTHTQRIPAGDMRVSAAAVCESLFGFISQMEETARPLVEGRLKDRILLISEVGAVLTKIRSLKQFPAPRYKDGKALNLFYKEFFEVLEENNSLNKSPFEFLLEQIALWASQGSSKGTALWLGNQNGHASTNIPGQALACFNLLVGANQKSAGKLNIILRADIVPKEMKQQALFIEACEKSPVNRAIYDPIENKWRPIPKLENFSSFNRDEGISIGTPATPDVPTAPTAVPTPTLDELLKLLSANQEASLSLFLDTTILITQELQHERELIHQGITSILKKDAQLIAIAQRLGIFDAIPLDPKKDKRLLLFLEKKHGVHISERWFELTGKTLDSSGVDFLKRS